MKRRRKGKTVKQSRIALGDYQEEQIIKLQDQLAHLESLYAAILERTAKVEYELFGPKPKPDGTSYIKWQSEAATKRKPPAEYTLKFPNVDIVKIDDHGHYTPSPVCVSGYFKPGDKVQVTVEPYNPVVN